MKVISFVFRIKSIFNNEIICLVRRVQVPLFDQSTPSTNIESVTDTSTVSSMEIIKENPEIILGGFSGILPANFQNRFEGNRRTGNRMVSS